MICVPVNGAAGKGDMGVMVAVEEMEHCDVRIRAPKEDAEGEVGRDERLILPMCWRAGGAPCDIGVVDAGPVTVE